MLGASNLARDIGAGKGSMSCACCTSKLAGATAPRKKRSVAVRCSHRNGRAGLVSPSTNAVHSRCGKFKRLVAAMRGVRTSRSDVHARRRCSGGKLLARVSHGKRVANCACSAGIGDQVGSVSVTNQRGRTFACSGLNEVAKAASGVRRGVFGATFRCSSFKQVGGKACPSNCCVLGRCSGCNGLAGITSHCGHGV